MRNKYSDGGVSPSENEEWKMKNEFNMETRKITVKFTIYYLWKPGGRHNDSDGGVSPSENENSDFFFFFSFPLKKAPKGDTMIAMKA